MRSVTFNPNFSNIEALKSSGADLLWPPAVTDIAISIPGNHSTIREIIESPEFRREVLLPQRPWAKMLNRDIEMFERVIWDGDRRFVNAYLATIIRKKKFGGLLCARSRDVMSAAFVAWVGLVSDYRPRTPFSAWIGTYLGLRIASMLGKEFSLVILEPLEFDIADARPPEMSDRERLFIEAVVPAIVTASMVPQVRKVVEGWLFSQRPLPEVARRANMSHSHAWRIVSGILHEAILSTGRIPPRMRMDLDIIGQAIAHFLPPAALSSLLRRSNHFSAPNDSIALSSD